MGTISGSFRRTEIRLVHLGQNRWRVEFWDWNTGDTAPFGTLELMTTDPKAGVLGYLYTVFKNETEESIKRDLKWNDSSKTEG